MLTTLALCACAVAQGCTDPPVPGGGFTVTSKLNRLLTFSDGRTTRADIRYPSAAPGTCGWPILVFVHGMGGTRTGMATIATDFAKLGYCTLAYDVRGQGVATGLHTHYGLRERIDLGEAIYFVETSFPAVADLSRVGVNGASQGGLHTWMAAVLDGQPYPANPWNSGNFPDIDAVVAENCSPDYRANFAPQSIGVNAVSGFHVTHGTIHFDPVFENAARSAWLAEDWSAWAALTAGSATHDLAPFVPAITCPTLAMMAFDDHMFSPQALAQQWMSLSPGISRKLYLGTGGHSSPFNDAELAFRAGWRQAWFDHFLKGAANGIESGPQVVYAVTPDDLAAYQSTTSIWSHRSANAWPPEDAVPMRFYLHEGQTLLDTPPLSTQSPAALTQTVAPDYTMDDVLADEFALTSVLAGVPRVTIAWESSALTSDLEFAGDARLHLVFDSAQTRWHVRARLCDVAPGSASRPIAGGSYFAWDTFAAGPGSADVVVSSNAYVFRAGHKLRLELENLAIVDQPSGPAALVGAPITHDFTLQVRHDPSDPGFIELPLRSCPAPVTFGAGILNSAGCRPAISAAGTPSASSPSPFTISVDEVVNQKPGLLFVSFSCGALPFYGGTLYVAGTTSGLRLGNSGGNIGLVDCSGSYACDFNARIQSGVDPQLVPGRTVFTQCYYRDSALPTGVGLSDALQFVICL